MSLIIYLTYAGIDKIVYYNDLIACIHKLYHWVGANIASPTCYQYSARHSEIYINNNDFFKSGKWQKYVIWELATQVPNYAF